MSVRLVFAATLAAALLAVTATGPSTARSGKEPITIVNACCDPTPACKPGQNCPTIESGTIVIVPKK